jgi:hypothetical protein
MKASIDATAVRTALEKTGQDLFLRLWSRDGDQKLRKIAAGLKQFVHEYRRRFKETPDILGLLDENTPKARAFFHFDTLMASCEMKIMVWRLLMGGEIRAVNFRYRAGKPSSLRVQLQLFSPPWRRETYESTEALDFRVLRHLGLAGEEGQGRLQGYYV